MSINYTAASDKAKKYLQKNQLDRAIALWTDFLPNAADNDAANALNNLGDLSVRKKNTVAAIDHYLKASHAFENAGFPLKAIATLKKVLKIDPDRAEVYLRLGDLNARRDMIGNAVESYLHVARLMVAQGERDEALTMVQKICILDPVNTRHRLQLAAELFELGFAEQAIDETVNAIDLFLEAGNLEEAERYCRHLLDLKPGCEAAQERLERIARWGAERPEGRTSEDDEGSIDDLFAELDGAGPASDASDASHDAEEAPAPEAPVADGFTLDLGPAGPAEPEAGEASEAAPEDTDEAAMDAAADIRDLLESSSVAAPEEDDAPAGFGDIELESTSLDTGEAGEEAAEAAPAASDADALHGEAVDRLQSGDLEAALDAFDQLTDAHLAAGDPAAADAALGDYLAIDPDNPRAYEIRLRIVSGHDRDAELATLNRLADLCRETDPDRAHEFEARAAALTETGAEAAEAPESPAEDEPAAPVFELSPEPAEDDAGGSMAISLDDISLAADQAVDAAEVAPEPEPEAEPEAAAGEWSLDLDAGDTAEGLADAPAQAHDDAHAEAPTETPAEADDEPLDTASLDLAAHLHDEPEEPEPVAVDLSPASGEAPDVDLMPGLEIGGPGQDSDAEPAHAEAPSASAHGGGFDVKEALTEARFYERQGLKEEAIQAYRNVLTHEPDNAEAAKRLSGMGIQPPAPPAHPAPTAAAPAEAAHEDSGAGSDGGSDEFLDFTETIENTIENEVSGAWRKVGEEAQFDEILDAFRKGIQAEVSDDDAETHYDLGLAYHEMGLTEEAIGEFQLAVKGVTRFADATIMLARCFTEVGKERLAVARLRTAVARPDCGEDEWISLAYELASVLESLGEKEEARQMYEEVYSRDITYRDVAERVSQLS
jgi:pilus assembly protein FimV